MLTSNKSFEDWGAVLGDDVMAAALIDRLLHHCHIATIRANSYQMRAHQKLWPSMQWADSDASPTRGTEARRQPHGLRWLAPFPGGNPGADGNDLAVGGRPCLVRSPQNCPQRLLAPPPGMVRDV